LGRALEGLRYRAYTLERALVLGASARARLADVRLYVLVTGSQCTHSLEWTIRRAAVGGAQAFQLREKGLGDRALLERARQGRRGLAERTPAAFALGGVRRANLRQVVAAGARRVAVSGAICRAEDACAAATAMRQILVSQ